ncbi:MAG: hypothetical protein F4Y64_09765 [Rhodothermaceae bacterium]|nr:hypothetical protein [Rhodothermaceae bacterium]
MSVQRAQGPNSSTATLSRLKMTLRSHPNASYLTFKFSKKGFFGQILIYETLDPSGLWPVYWEKLKAAGQWAPTIDYPSRFYRYSSAWVYGGSASEPHDASTPC